MRFTWDPRKSQSNLERRNLDFEFAALIFEGLTLEREDARRDYGERRLVAIGVVEQEYLTVVYTDRHSSAHGLERRIISARRSKRRERNTYIEAYEQAAESGPSKP